MRALLWSALLALGVAATPFPMTPVGRFRLATVDGVRVPMVWRQVEREEGGTLQLHWVSGRGQIREDGTFELNLTALRTGHGLSGTPEQTLVEGTWRMVPGRKVEMRFPDGRVSYWEDPRFARLELRGLYPDLDGRSHPATMVLVRD